MTMPSVEAMLGIVMRERRVVCGLRIVGGVAFGERSMCVLSLSTRRIETIRL
jgi:hypothetical protein